MKTYAEYYKLCKESYNSSNQKMDLYDLKMRVCKPDEKNELFTFPDNYSELIDSLSEKINAKVNDKSQHYVDPSASGYDIAIQIKEIWDLPELKEIAGHILPCLEETVFGSHIHCSAIHIYRNIPTDSPKVSSWLWHYDNNPKEAVKLLIYLTDVEEDTGPFELLEHDNDYVKIQTSRTGHDHWLPPYIPQSRIPENIMNDFINQGYEKTKIIGSKGTALFFDNNIVHKANVPTRAYRDVVIFNIRPTMLKLDPYISRNFTGTWGHKSPIMNPEELIPRLK
jgi:hypothetical protein